MYRKHNELIEYNAYNEGEITNHAAYYRQAMQNIVLGELLKPAEIQAEFRFLKPFNTLAQ